MSKSTSFFIVLCISFIISACVTNTKTETETETPLTGMAAAEPVEKPLLAQSDSDSTSEPVTTLMKTDGAPTVASIKLPQKPILAEQKQKPIVTVVEKPRAVTIATIDKPIVKRSILKASKVISFQGQDYCKQYNGTKTFNGVTEAISGIACKQANGKWRTMS